MKRLLLIALLLTFAAALKITLIAQGPVAGVEMLVYDGTSYWESRPDLQLKYPEKYERRWRKGFVVEIRERGGFTDPKTGAGWDRKKFRLVSIDGMTKAEANQYAAPGKDMRYRYMITSGTLEKEKTVAAKDLVVADVGGIADKEVTP